MLEIDLKVGSQIKGTSKSQKTMTRQASPQVVHVEVTTNLRILSFLCL
jgi:hypothetical protein